MATTLTLLGCDYLQGFGLSRPKNYEKTLTELTAIQSAGDAAPNPALTAQKVA